MLRPLLLLAPLVCLPCLPLAATAAEPAPAGAPPADSGWEVRERDDRAGWTLYARPEAGSRFLRYRLVGHTHESLDRVIRALRIKAEDSRYLPDGRVRRVLERGDDFLVSHVTIDAPFIADRDVFLHTQWQTDPQSGVYTVTWQPPQGELPPPTGDTVRIATRGQWTVTPLAEGGCEVRYENHSELGSVPAWMINRMMDDQIISELVVLNEILERDLPSVATGPARD